ncbi:protein OSB1, mitochondrial-like [Hibiscus syriacus]|uniref:protein OSB1, mitochondrial-like n=1 Tax=Hibiscus syriacus TaxID=106335 RepID=UPI001920F697|nr:protein OSB1, mitochondrial-like [Hibiscus syriacus]
MIIRRIGTLIARRISQFPLPNRTSLYSSAASNRRISNHFEGDEEGGSAAYRLALKFQRPKTVQVERGSRNRVSLIGTVDVPLTVMNTKSDKFGVRTRLIIKKPYDSDRRFKYLKQDRVENVERYGENLYGAREAWGFFLYVSGFLGSFSQANVDKQLIVYYKVNVTELNFVSQQGQRSTTRKCEELEPEQDPGEAGMERYNSPLYLWQVFFTSLSEWWDNRKKNPSQPDFKHKDTGEALWLNPDDPPWIRKQLELLDSRLAQGAGDQVSCRNCISEWVYDE